MVVTYHHQMKLSANSTKKRDHVVTMVFVMCWLQERLRNTRWGRSSWVRPISGLKTVYGGERDADTPKILLSFSQQVSLLADKPTLSCLICALWIVDCGWHWQQESPGAMTKKNLRIRCHIDLSSAISSF